MRPARYFSIIQLSNSRAQGRPYKYISYEMIKEAIKEDGKVKLSNIENNDGVMKLWSDLNKYCTEIIWVEISQSNKTLGNVEKFA